MPTFRYTAVDPAGQPVTDSVTAADVAAARRQLEELGLTDIVVDASHEELAVTPAEKPLELTDADFLSVADSVAQLAAAGKPLSGGLRALAEESPSRRLRRGLRQVADRLDSGTPLDEVFSTRISGFPPHLGGLVTAGIKAGCLDRVLQQSLTYGLRATALRRRVKSSLAYPLLVMGITAALGTFILAYIVPLFSKIFSDFDTEMPGLTLLIVWISDMLVAYGLYIVGGGLALAVAVVFVIRAALGPRYLRRLIYQIPLVGGALRYSALMEYCHLLAVLIESRMPLPDALRYAGGGIRDADLAAASSQVADDIVQGQPFAWTLSSMPQFPAVFGQFAKWGERHNRFPEAFHAAGDVFEGRARFQASLIAWVIEPILIIGIAGMTASVIVALFMPIIKLLNDLA